MADDNIIEDSNSVVLAKVEQIGVNQFKAPKRIIQSVTAARAMYQVLLTQNLERIALWSEIQGLVDGNPPYDPDVLRNAGLDSVANFNDQSAGALIARGCLAYWNLNNNAEYIAKVTLRGADPELLNIARILSRNWDWVIRNRWKSFAINMAALTNQIVTLGISPVIFPDERDPRWRVVDLNRFLVADQAQSDLDLLGTVMVTTEFTIQELWQTYLEFKDKPKDASPWNVDALGAYIASFIPTGENRDATPIDYMEIHRRLNNADLTIQGMYSQTVKIVSLLQREYSGKISHYMFSSRYTATTGAPVEDFLFFQQDQYEAMDEAVIIFTYNPGAKTIHANKGLGHRIFPLAQAKIQMSCSVVDMAKWASTPIVKSASANANDVEQIRFYPGVPTNIGTADFVQNNLGANVEQVVGAAQYVDNQIQFNISYSGSDSSRPDPDQGSLAPTQVTFQAFNEFSVLKNNIMHFYSTEDTLIYNMFVKMWHSKDGDPGYYLREEWEERCVEEGVPKEFFTTKGVKKGKLPKNMEVSATRVAGSGSQVSHLLGLQMLQPIAGSFTADEADWYKKQTVTAALGPEALSVFAKGVPDEQKGGASVAALENSIMQDGKSPVFSSDNEQRAHIATHMALLMQVSKALQEGQIDPVAADKVYNVAIPHTAEHIQAEGQSPFAVGFINSVKPAFDQVVQLATLNRKNAQAMLEKQQKTEIENAQNQQKAMSEEELKNFVTMNEERRSDEKLAAQSRRQEELGENKKAALFAKTNTDIEIKKAKAAGELELKSIKDKGDIGTQRLKTVLEANAQKEKEATSTLSKNDFK